MTKTRWAILGPGAISRDFVAGLRSSEFGSLQAVGSSSPARAAEFGREFGAEATGTYDEVLIRDDVDAVYIGTVHATHADLAERALKHGKAVLCEKPATTSLADLERVLAAAEESDRPFLEAYKTRFGPFSDRLTSLVASRELGIPETVHASFGFDAVVRQGRLFDAEVGGGAILDVGCYPVSFVVQVAGAAGLDMSTATLSVTASESDAGVDVDTTAEIRVGTLVATVHAAIVRTLPRSGVVGFSGGAIEIPELWGSRTQSPTDMCVKRDDSQHSAKLPAIQPMAAEADAVSLAIQEGRIEVPQMPWSHSQAVARLLDTWRADVAR